MFISQSLIVAIALIGSISTSYASSNIISDDHPDVLTSNLIEWLRDNGAYINEKLVVRHLLPDDPTSPRGVFATEDMEEGEPLCSIPMKLIIQPRVDLMDGAAPENTHCGTVRAVMEAISGDEMTPYGKYLLHQPKNYLPSFWSKTGVSLLDDMLTSTRTEKLTEYDELPPHGWDDLSDFIDECSVDVDDPLHRHSAMLVQARADYDYMIPFYDLFNHHNGKYNMKHKVDPYKNRDKKAGLSQLEAEGAGFVTTKPIKAGEELYNSYNHCNICYEYFDWVGTPEMFLNYGFVESYPQRWLFDFARIKFDLDWDMGTESTGIVELKFLVPPSEKGLMLLTEELKRLEVFGAKNRNKSAEYFEKGMTTSEWDSFWQYFDALDNAMSHAVLTAETLSDEVWELSDDWWVQDGTLKASDDGEHHVLPTESQPLPTDMPRQMENDEL